jgi:diaminopimelate epimerase
MAAIKIPFTKMSGAGNDFVVVDNRNQILKNNLSAFARVLSERRRGIGSDGVLIVEESSRADFLMKYYNADGSFGGFCGNGGRCVARYAFLQGFTSSRPIFEALGHLYQAEVDGSRVRLKMMDPRDEKLGVSLHCEGKILKVHQLNTGAPHVVIFLDENQVLGSTNLSSIDVPRIGREIRYDSYFGTEGTNVNFVAPNGDGSLNIRTYERGVEGETLACGTGSVASALIASKVMGLQSPVKVIPKSKEPLIVEFLRTKDSFTDVYLVGNADIVFRGELRYDPESHRLVE